MHSKIILYLILIGFFVTEATAQPTSTVDAKSIVQKQVDDIKNSTSLEDKITKLSLLKKTLQNQIKRNDQISAELLDKKDKSALDAHYAQAEKWIEADIGFKYTFSIFLDKKDSGELSCDTLEHKQNFLHLATAPDGAKLSDFGKMGLEIGKDLCKLSK